jgi:putative copper export protein
VLPIDATTIRLFIHVLAATVWVGGQLTLAGLVPVVRTLGPEATKAVARQFDRIAWPAFAALVLTGLWNLMEVDVGDTSTEYQITLMVKLLFVGLTAGGAAAHRAASSKAVLAIGGAAAALGAIAALFLGISLRT